MGERGRRRRGDGEVDKEDVEREGDGETEKGLEIGETEKGLEIGETERGKR